MLKVAEAAKLLRCSEKTAYRMVKEGTLPTVRVGKQLRIPVAEFESRFKIAVNSGPAERGLR
jgi:excisionase family DNA binding protein